MNGKQNYATKPPFTAINGNGLRDLIFNNPAIKTIQFLITMTFLKNLMRLMNDDGIFKYLPKVDDQWVEFLQPFMKLSRKEKKRYNIKN